MNKQYSPIEEVLDSNILVKTIFIRKDGKLRMAREKLQTDTRLSTQSERPLFPISKDRR